MHENEIYSKKPSPEAVAGLAKTIQSRLNIICTEPQFSQILDKCRKFIYKWTKLWHMDYSLLEITGENSYRRTKQFDEQLRGRRWQWIALPDITSLDGADEVCFPLSVPFSLLR
jgi:hypothetical protein